MTLEKSWHDALEKELQEPYITELKQFLSHERRSHQVFPPEDLVFNAFRQTPFADVKVVILGQDPYHGPGQAHGLCFSVERGVKPPPSLVNIYKELKSDLGIPPPSHGTLTHWAKQGVLLLNTTLTVRRKEPKSHYGKGWERFTDSVIAALRDREDPVVFLLWGKSAQEKCDAVLNVQPHPHVVLSCAHPSPYSAQNFLGCRHFSQTNAYLTKWGKKEIDWAL